MGLMASAANEADLDYYTNGCCHHLAIALNRKLGWTIDVRTDASEPYWQDEDDADNFLPAVLHVYAIDKQGRAWDVRGSRPEAAVQAEIQEAYFPGEPGSEEFARDTHMQCYVGCWGDEGEEIDRPLTEYTDHDIDEAWGVACRIFAGMEGFDASLVQSPQVPSRPGM